MQITCQAIATKSYGLESRVLQTIAELYSRCSHKAFALLARHNIAQAKAKPYCSISSYGTSLSQKDKLFLQQSYGLNSRYVNSINIQLQGNIRSYLELLENHRKDMACKAMASKVQFHAKARQLIMTEFPQLQVIFAKKSRSDNLCLKGYYQQQLKHYENFLIEEKDKPTVIKQKSKTRSNQSKNAVSKQATHKFVFSFNRSYGLPQIVKTNDLNDYLKKFHAQLSNQNSSWTGDYKAFHKEFMNFQELMSLVYRQQVLAKKLQRKEAKLKRLNGDIAQGKLRICFGSKNLFSQQNNLQDNDNHNGAIHKNHEHWYKEFHDSRMSQFWLTGAAEESAGNLNCQASYHEQSNRFTLRINVPAAVVAKLSDKETASLEQKIKGGVTSYFLDLKDIDFHKDTDFIIQSISGEKIQVDYTVKNKAVHENGEKVNESATEPIIKSRIKRMGQAVSYRFVRNTDSNSPKYGLWYVHATTSLPQQPISSNIGRGAIGMDFNHGFLSVSETNAHGKLLQSFNLWLNPQRYSEHDVEKFHNNKDSVKTLRLLDRDPDNENEYCHIPVVEHELRLSDKTECHRSKPLSTGLQQLLLGKALAIVTDLAYKTGKPLVMEVLDFTAKKKALRYDNVGNGQKSQFKKNYSHMLTSFAYSKYQQLAASQCQRKGVELITVNPAYTSVIGEVNHGKRLGISGHMAASYTIARRGMTMKELQGNGQKKVVLEDLLEEVHWLNDKNIGESKELIDRKFAVAWKGQSHEWSCIVNSETGLAPAGDLLSTWRAVAGSCREHKKSWQNRKTQVAIDRDNSLLPEQNSELRLANLLADSPELFITYP